MYAAISNVPAPSRKPLTVFGLLAVTVLGLMAVFPSHALDLVAFTGIAGPLVGALTLLASLGPGIKALVGGDVPCVVGT